MFRKHLYYSPQEVDDMPWHLRRAFAEMLQREFDPESAEEPTKDVDTWVDPAALGLNMQEV